MEASIALLGSKGSMLATSPSIVARTPPETLLKSADGDLEPAESQSLLDSSNTEEQEIDVTPEVITVVSLYPEDSHAACVSFVLVTVLLWAAPRRWSSLGKQVSQSDSQ